MHRPGRFPASRALRACRRRAPELRHWHGHAAPRCGHRGTSGGGNGLFSMCLATNVQCEWIREEAPVSPSTFCSFTLCHLCPVLSARHGARL